MLHIHPVKVFSLFKKAAVAWMDDFAPSMGAAISYYTVFSLAPLLVIVIAIAGAVFGREAVQGQISSQIAGIVGEQGAKMVEGLIAASSDTDKGKIAGLISIVILIVGATTVFNELQSALDRIWKVPEAAKPSGIWGLLRERLLSFGLVLGVAFLLMVSLVVSAALAAFGAWAGGLMPGSVVLLEALNLCVTLALLTVLFGLIYRFMPSTTVNWREVWVGAFVTAVLFVLGKLLISLYINKSGMGASFQAAGALVIVLVWVYYAAQIFLLGAEFTKAYADADRPPADQRVVHQENPTKDAPIRKPSAQSSEGA